LSYPHQRHWRIPGAKSSGAVGPHIMIAPTIYILAYWQVRNRGAIMCKSNDIAAQRMVGRIFIVRISVGWRA
jgi:hypothetical protein